MLARPAAEKSQSSGSENRVPIIPFSFSDSVWASEIDSFCLAEGVEITDLSDEAVAAGIKSYLGLNNEDIAQDEDESQGMSIDL